MAVVILPRINPSDYDAVRRIINLDLPDTHDKWLNLQVQKELDIRGQGHACRHIQIDPDELARYCDRYPHDRNQDGLQNFAIKKAGGTNY